MDSCTKEECSENGESPIARVYTQKEHGIQIKNIDPDALKILNRLQRFGYRAYVVGGGVRDLLLEKPPKDFDIATEATPRQVKALFRNSRIIGRRFKLVHVFFNGLKIIEVSTFRDTTNEAEIDDGSPQDIEPIKTDNTYGNEQTDALRRDISINALFLDTSDMTIVDYVDGMKDFRHELVRVIGNPDVRFAEDPVRLLRVVRHSVRSGFNIEDECWNSLVRNSQLILKSSSVRVYEELKKDLCSGHFLEILRLLNESGLLEHLLPAVAKDASALLGEGVPLAAALNRLDKAVKDGQQISHTAILACIVFFTAVPGIKELDVQKHFPDEEDVHEQLLRCMHGLNVPRKERERIDGILTLWLFLETDSRRFNMRRNREEKEALRDLIQISGAPGNDLLLEKLRHAGSSQSRSQDPRRKSNRRSKPRNV